MTAKILLSPPDVGDLEERYVREALRSGWVAPAGPDLDLFESEVARRVGRDYAVALSSGTAALHLALVSWGVGPGDVVPVSTLTFAASVNAIRYVGATPYLIDSDAEDGNLSVDLLETALRELHDQGAKVPAVIPVDLLGRCADYSRLEEALEPYPGTRALADSAESFGASRDGVAAGAFGDAAVLSFNGNKIMTTSGGGMLLTDDEALAAHVRKLSTQAREPAIHYEHREIGYNYRLSNINAALGRAQLARLDEMLAKRREWRRRYRDFFAPISGTRVLGPADDRSDNCWLTAVIINSDVVGMTASDVIRTLGQAGIETRPVWKPMHLQPVSEGLPRAIDGTAEGLFESGVTLPSGSGMSPADFDLVIAALENLAW